MGTVHDIDAARAGTTLPGRLRIMVRVLSKRPDLNTPRQQAQLAAAKRLLEKAEHAP